MSENATKQAQTDEWTLQMASISSIHYLDFSVFLTRFKWRQGEHLSILGTTGAGKSFLAFKLLPRREYIAFMATKPRDETLTRFARENRYEVIKNWPPSPRTHRAMLWPTFKQPGDEVKQAASFHKAFMRIFVEGSWTVYIDEAYYFTKILGFERMLKLYWTQARSNDITVVAATQRPRDVPLLMYDQATHLFFFRFQDKRDLERLGDIGWINGEKIRETVANLRQHQFLYINNISGEMCVSRA